MASPHPPEFRMLTRAAQYEEVVEELGGAKMAIVDKDLPPLESDQVLVQTVCAAVNPIDLYCMFGHCQRTGWAQSFPFTPGYDVSGIVAGVGSEVTEFSIGDPVFAVNWGDVNKGAPGNTHDDAGKGPVAGTWARHCIMPARKLSKKPDGLPFDVACGVSLVGTTAMDCLKELGIGAATEKVVILGGSGAVGFIAIQLAKHYGAKEVITTASPRTREFVEQSGADRIIDYTTANWWEDPEIKGCDAVMDLIGEADSLAHAKATLKEDGSYIAIASFDAGMDPTAHAPLKYCAFHVLSNSRANQDELADLLLQGKVISPVNERFPFTQKGIDDMIAVQKGGKSMGKNVLVM